MNFEKAIEIATAYYIQHGKQEITKVYDAEGLWVVFARKDGKARVGGNGISIDKTTGEIKTFVLPSKENFALLDSAQLIEL